MRMVGGVVMDSWANIQDGGGRWGWRSRRWHFVIAGPGFRAAPDDRRSPTSTGTSEAHLDGPGLGMVEDLSLKCTCFSLASDIFASGFSLIREVPATRFAAHPERVILHSQSQAFQVLLSLANFEEALAKGTHVQRIIVFLRTCSGINPPGEESKDQ